MKFTLFSVAAALLFSSIGLASTSSRDSVAVFHRAEKIIVLVNEAGRNSRLQSLMSILGGENDILLMNADQSIKLDCGRSETAVSCTFRFFPSPATRFGERSLDAVTSLTELGAEAHQDLEIAFESSRQDRFVLSIAGSTVRFHAEKKILKP